MNEAQVLSTRDMLYKDEDINKLQNCQLIHLRLEVPECAQRLAHVHKHKCWHKLCTHGTDRMSAWQATDPKMLNSKPSVCRLVHEETILAAADAQQQGS